VGVVILVVSACVLTSTTKKDVIFSDKKT